MFIYNSHVQDVIEGGRMRTLTRPVDGAYSELETRFGAERALTDLHESKLEPYMEGMAFQRSYFNPKR